VSIFDLYPRLRLERQGLSSGKRRRKVPESGFWVSLEEAGWAKGGLFAAFSVGALLLVFLARAQGALLAGREWQSALLIGSLIGTLAIQFGVNHGTAFRSNRQVLLVLGAIFGHVAWVRVAFLPVDQGALPEAFRYVLPAYALAPMAISVLMGRSQGIFVAIYASLLGALLVSAEKAFGFMVLSLVSGFLAVHLTRQVRRRGTLVLAGVFVGLVTGLLAFATGQIEVGAAGWQGMAAQFGCAVGVGLATSMAVGGFLPFLESWFRLSTVFTWLEFSDLNHPLLRRLSYEAPGTHHHSLMVATLAERAAEEIGANAGLCRAAAYFHDIGKLSKPLYFIENTAPGDNPHDDLTPTMSALVLVAHVKDGVDLALKHGLPKEIINVIREHHGNSVIQYFYHRALEQRSRMEALVAEGKASPEDLPVVQVKDFRYPGPKPRSRESAIVSLADSVESASRSLAKATPNRIEQLIAELTEQRLLDGQLDDSDLTLAELAKIRKSFHATLCSVMHTRIPYPGEPMVPGPKKKRPDGERSRDKSAVPGRSGTSKPEAAAAPVPAPGGTGRSGGREVSATLSALASGKPAEGSAP
jgi:putative nucleotidyltransferase with HDIG domain